MNPESRHLSHTDLFGLARWNTPTIYNGLEQLVPKDLHLLVNREETRDFMPHQGPMIGYAVTVVIQPGNPEHQMNTTARSEYRAYMGKTPGPKIVVVQDLDKPDAYGAFWGEVNSNWHRALGCVGTITDGAVRDLDEMNAAGFKAIARRMCVGHAFSTPVRWNCEVEVFGTRVRPGDLIHADKHGFIIIPAPHQERILEAARFMDAGECATVIPSGRDTAGKSVDEILDGINRANAEYRRMAREKFDGKGEW
jgi:4-hydroxy-4-methyl-2-oxoglutarate aldolase